MCTNSLSARPQAARARVVQSADGIDLSPLDARAFRHLELPNGLQALVVSDPESETAAAAMDVRVGFHSDPDELPGLAHFCEHMLFLGTDKYPDENSYSVFLNAHGGSSNAFTSARDTNFYFDVAAPHLHEALDRFAQFFIAPRFTPAATERELNAVDSESTNYLQDDSWRINQLERGLGNPRHPYRRFGVGNLETLSVTPKEKDLDVRQALLDFYERFYSASIMKLVVYGSQSVDTLTQWVHQLFNEIPNSGRESPSFAGEPPYTAEQLGRRVDVVPVMDWKVVQVSWVLPPLRGGWVTPQHTTVLSHLIGHEGEGSLLSFLKKKLWVNSVYAGIVEDYDEFSLFVVSFETTEDGVAQAEGVLRAMFQYLQLLLASPWEAWMFEELENLATTHFLFRSKTPPADFASLVAENMQVFSRRDIISEGALYFPFEWEQTVKVLQMMTPEKMRMLVACQSVEDVAMSEERWYGTKYREVSLTPEFLAEMNSPGRNDALFLPQPNDFVLSQLDLVDRSRLDTLQKHPRVIRDDNLCRVWYKPDVAFRKPRTFAVVTFHSPEVNPSPHGYALSSLFAACLEDELAEYSYDAQLAGMSYKLRHNGSTIYLSAGGYSPKLGTLIQRILRIMCSFDRHVSEEAFGRVKQSTCRSFENKRLEEAHRHATEEEASLLIERGWLVAEIVDALRSCTFQQLLMHAKRLFRQVYLDMLVYGNLDSVEASALADLVVDQVRTPATLPMLPSQRYWTGRQVKLPGGVHSVYRKLDPNPDNTNCAVDCVYQIGVENYLERAKLALLSQIVEEPLFDQLRTKEQLGYTVYSTPSRGSGIQLFQVVVQSSVASPEFIDQRIEAFWTELRKTMSTMDSEELQRHIEAVVKGYSEKPKSQEEEVRALLVEISNHQYVFDRKLKLAQLVRTLQLTDVLEFFDTYIRRGSPQRKKLSVYIYGNATRLEAFEDCSQTDGSVFNDASQTSILAAMSLGASFASSEEEKTEYISNPLSFKRRAQMYEVPVPSIIPR